MSKFTPGPWHHIDVPSVRSLFNGCSCIFSEHIDDAIVASIGEDVPNHVGNANLIAAAPELYEALKALCSANTAANLAKAQAAILKAEGRQ